jgi:hypothetical protein
VAIANYYFAVRTYRVTASTNFLLIVNGMVNINNNAFVGGVR